MPRKKLIAANWKMCKTPGQACEFFASFLSGIRDHERDEIAFFPSFVCIPCAVEAVKGSRVAIGGQNMFWEKEGAYTGEISAGMLLGAGCTHVILGHSERRQYFGETDEMVNRKLKVALETGLTPIVCVGEVLEEREAGLTGDVLRRQCQRGFSGISGEKAAKLVVAYEPVWAIGTGLTPSLEQIEAIHAEIRAVLSDRFEEAGGDVPILYGGSVKPANAREILRAGHVDGALVGGASLKASDFLPIVEAARAD